VNEEIWYGNKLALRTPHPYEATNFSCTVSVESEKENNSPAFSVGPLMNGKILYLKDTYSRQSTNIGQLYKTGMATVYWRFF
jgi:hypothetical protein